MSIPEHIRNVKRPVNTVVKESKSDSIYKYYVVQRKGCKRVNGTNQPVDGGTIGHIIEGKFVAKAKTRNIEKSLEYKDYSNAIFVDKISKPLLDELYEVYNSKDAIIIYVIALLRVLYPGVRDYQLERKYSFSWLSVIYPGLPLSKNTVSNFIKDLGGIYSSVVEFMRNRVMNVLEDSKIAIDGTLITDNSTVNTLSQYSRKTRIKGTKDISVIFAYDIETKEPICSKVYGGNVVDQRAYEDFVDSYGINKGVIMGDKGFPKKQADNFFKENPSLSWINPVKRNDKRIINNDILKYTNSFKYENKIILTKKHKIKDYYLYSFYDKDRAAKEENDYLERNFNKGFDAENHRSKKKNFGTIVFESSLDEEPKLIYTMYEQRWLIEECFRYYKQGLDLNTTRVHSDQSVVGTQLINFIASNITTKLINIFTEKKLLNKKTYKQIMNELKQAKKVLVDNEWKFLRIPIYVQETLQLLEILPVDPGEPIAKRGRPRKQN